MNTQTLDKKSTVISIGIIGTMFFIFGFVSWVNAILIPYFKIACELSHFQSYLVAFAFYISYLVMSMPSSYLLNRVGYKTGITIGFWIMAAGALLFVPAAYGRTYVLFLIGLFTLGSGLAILQTVANLYITMIGEKERAAQRISIMGICNKGAGILAPLAFSWAILRPTDNELFKQIPLMDEVTRSNTLDELILRVVVPYIVVAAVLFLIGLFVKFSPLPEIQSNHDDQQVEKRSGVFQFPNLVLGAIAIFLHVGTQVIAIDTIINYAGSMGVSLVEAKVLPSYVLSANILGYLLGITLIPVFISQKRMLQICTIIGLTLSILVCLMGHPVSWLGMHMDISIWFLAMIGLPNALIWAGIWPLALDGLGKFAKQGSALLIMGLCGNAILPMIYGAVAEVSQVKTGYWVLVPCFSYLVYYAFVGHRFKYWRKGSKQ